MAVDPLRRRIHDDVGAPFERVAEVSRRAERVVHHERDVDPPRQRGQCLQIGNGAGRVAHAFDIEGFGPLVRERFEVLRAFAGRDAAVDAQVAQRDAELVVRAAVEVRRGHDIVAAAGQRQHREENRRHARRHGQCADGSVECRDTLFVGRRRGVLQAGVDVARLAQFEQPGRVVAVAETVGGRGTDRHAPGSGLGVGLQARMDLQGFESVVFRIHRVCRLKSFTKKSDLLGSRIVSRYARRTIPGENRCACASYRTSCDGGIRRALRRMPYASSSFRFSLRFAVQI